MAIGMLENMVRKPSNKKAKTVYKRCDECPNTKNRKTLYICEKYQKTNTYMPMNLEYGFSL